MRGYCACHLYCTYGILDLGNLNNETVLKSCTANQVNKEPRYSFCEVAN